MDHIKQSASVCIINPPDYSNVTIIEVDNNPDRPVKEYLQAMKIADKIAFEAIGENMLLSWYDQDRDFESPQHSSECHSDSAVPGYVDYGLYHGATLKIDFEKGRFVFFYLPIE